MTITKETIDRIFENAEDQGQYCLELYRCVFPRWDEIKSIDGWPTISKALSSYIFNKSMDFDSKHHPECIAGGLWMNKGFSTLAGDNLNEWEVSLDNCRVEY